MFLRPPVFALAALAAACGTPKAAGPAATVAAIAPAASSAGAWEPAAPASAAPEPSTPASAASALPEPFEAEEGRWGYRAADGRVVVPAHFALAEPFSEQGIAAVADDSGFMIIDTRGRVLLRPFVFDNGPDPWSEGLARFVDGGKVGYFDERGRVVIAATFDHGEPFEGGRAAVCSGCRREYLGEHYRMVGGQWWQIDRHGQRVASLPAPAP